MENAQLDNHYGFKHPAHRYVASQILGVSWFCWPLSAIIKLECINTSRQVLEKTLFAINAIFTQDNNLSKTKVEESLQKTNATCSKCKTNLILTYLHRSRRHSSSQSQKRESTILSDKNKLLPNISSVNEIFGPTQCCPMVPFWKAFLKCTASEQESQSVQIVFCSLAVHVRKAFSTGYHR